MRTYNLNLGADLTPLFGATSLPTLQAAAAQVYADVVASKPDERIRAIARIIARQRPDVVGLQEVAQWQLATYSTYPYVVGPYQTTYDFLGLLIDDWRHSASATTRSRPTSPSTAGRRIPSPSPFPSRIRLRRATSTATSSWRASS